MSRFIIVYAHHWMDSCEFEVVKPESNVERQVKLEAGAGAHSRTSTFNYVHCTVLRVGSDEELLPPKPPKPIPARVLTWRERLLGRID